MQVIYEPARVDPFKIGTLVFTLVMTIITGCGVYFALSYGLKSNSDDIISLKATVNTMRDFALQRATMADQNSAKNIENDKVVAAQLNELKQGSMRLTSLEATVSAVQQRQDRLSELLLGNLDALRKDIQAGNDATRKDIGVLSTKVEVLDSKVSDLKEAKRVQPTSLGYLK